MGLRNLPSQSWQEEDEPKYWLSNRISGGYIISSHIDIWQNETIMMSKPRRGNRGKT
jgi:hypothetical protein